jgi:outer membrane lipase/esterase
MERTAMNIKAKLASLISVSCFVLLPFHAQAVPAYSDLYIFGDSLSDVGNVFAATGGTQPASPYADGQYSNGAVWVQGLAAQLGLNPLKPSLLGGNDYAFGGATTSYQPTTSTIVPNLTEQIGLYSLSLGGSPASASALYSVWIGANDIFNILDSGVDLNTALQQAKGAALAEANAIALLAGAGAKNFLVALLPDLGLTPSLTTLGPQASAAGSFLAASYNSALQSDLVSLVESFGLSMNYLDAYGLIDDAVGDPGAFGFSNVKDPCFTGTTTSGGDFCANPNQYLFWDDVHPTAAAQALIANAAISALSVPEPGSLLLIGIALTSLALARRKTTGHKHGARLFGDRAMFSGPC